MIKEHYLKQLDGLLQEVPPPIRHEWLYDYELHFQMAAEHGKDEEQAAAELGDPRIVAKELLLGYRVHQANARQNPVSVSKAVFAAVSLGFFNLVFVLGPYVALSAVLLALWVCAAALAVAGGAAIVEAIQPMGAFTMPQALSACALLVGLALLAMAGLQRLTKAFMAMTVRYLNWNSRMIKEK